MVACLQALTGRSIISSGGFAEGEIRLSNARFKSLAGFSWQGFEATTTLYLDGSRMREIDWQWYRGG